MGTVTLAMVAAQVNGGAARGGARPGREGVRATNAITDVLFMALCMTPFGIPCMVAAVGACVATVVAVWVTRNKPKRRVLRCVLAALVGANAAVALPALAILPNWYIAVAAFNASWVAFAAIWLAFRPRRRERRRASDASR